MIKDGAYVLAAKEHTTSKRAHDKQKNTQQEFTLCGSDFGMLTEAECCQF